MKLFTLLILTCVIGYGAEAQGLLPGSYVGMPMYGGFRQVPTDTANHNKWSLNKYAGVTTGFSFFNGGSASFVAVPVGLQLNRKLNDNLYAFAGVSVAPAYTNFNRAFLNSGAALKNNGFMYQPNNFSLNSRAELGLMYTNDEHTFQISGSIGVERRQYPTFGTLPQRQAYPVVK